MVTGVKKVIVNYGVGELKFNWLISISGIK
jgi:hypothetical protein